MAIAHTSLIKTEKALNPCNKIFWKTDYIHITFITVYFYNSYILFIFLIQILLRCPQFSPNVLYLFRDSLQDTLYLFVMTPWGASWPWWFLTLSLFFSGEGVLFCFVLFLFLIFLMHHAACGILVPQPGIKPVGPCTGSTVNHWTTKEVLLVIVNLLQYLIYKLKFIIVWMGFGAIWGSSYVSPSGNGCVHACSVAQSCLTLCDPMDCSPPGSSVHGILQARILEWVAISSSRGSSQPRVPTCISCIGRQMLYHWAT